MERYEDFEEKHPYVVTIGEAALAFAVKKGVQKVGEKFGVELRHGRTDNETRNKVIEKHPVVAAALVTTAAPVAEELLYRHLPSKGLDRLDSMERGSGKRSLAEIGITALFAAQHAGKDGIPLPQFLGGLVYQRAFSRRGLRHSIVAHATNNTLAVTEHLLSKKNHS